MHSEISGPIPPEVLKPRNTELLTELKKWPSLVSLRDYLSKPRRQIKEAEQQQLVENFQKDTFDHSPIVTELVKLWPSLEKTVQSVVSEIVRKRLVESDSKYRLTREIAIPNSSAVLVLNLEKERVTDSYQSLVVKIEMVDKSKYPDPQSKINLPKYQLGSHVIVKAEATFSIFTTPSTRINIETVILGREDLETEFPEARGVATLLGRASHRLNHIVTDNMTGLLEKRKVVAKMQDVSLNGWSSRRAAELGFTYTPHTQKQRLPGHIPDELKLWMYEYP